MASDNDPTSKKKPKILLVDDREDNLLSIEAILEPDGYQFFRAYSGHQALKILLKEFDFAMILMDVKMPALNGFETATLIYERDRLKNIPIIFITANNYGDDNLFKGYKAGGIDYIFKPINPEVLRAKVAVFVDIYLKNTQLLEQERNLEAANENLEHVNHRLQKHISDLESILASSPLGHATFEQGDLNDVLNEFIEDIQNEVRENTITVSIKPFPALPVSRGLVRPLLHQVIRMGLDPSADGGKSTIKIMSEIGTLEGFANSRNSSDQKYCHIIFEGSGASLASPGRQINGAAKKISNSLAICEKIMEQHQGFIQAKSSPDKATTFIISFPVKK